MKKIVSVLLLCAMLMSLVVVSSVSVSAEGETETPAAPRTGAYASIKPTIDGTIDEFWETAVRLDINSEIYAKVLWDEGGLYLLANVAGYEKISFLIAENYWGDESTSWEWDDQYTVTFYKDGKIDVLNPNYNWFHLPKTGVEQRAVKETSNGFVVEAYIPRVSEGAYAVNSGIKLGVVIDPWVNNGMLNWGAWTHEEWNGAKQVDWLTLAANSGLPQAKNTSIVLRGIQTTAMKDGTYDARFVSEMIGLDAECAGFEVSGFYGKDAEHQCGEQEQNDALFHNIPPEQRRCFKYSMGGMSHPAVYRYDRNGAAFVPPGRIICPLSRNAAHPGAHSGPRSRAPSWPPARVSCQGRRK